MAVYDVELFFDPVCPFCWVTSRWLVDVQGQRDLRVRWSPISLAILNEGQEPGTAMADLHARGHELLRVATAIDEQHGNEAVGRFYTAVGTAIHEVAVPGDEFEDVARAQATRPELGEVLAGLDLPAELAAATSETSYDEVIRASTQTARDRAGDDVGTPILTFGPPDGPSFFGPVLSEAPTGDRAVELYDALRTLAEHRPFTELKRSLRTLPATAALAGLR